MIQRGVNEDQILPLVSWAREQGVTLRFIEYMDVGETNQWQQVDVVTANEILEIVSREFEMRPLGATASGETAKRWQHADAEGEIGIIASVSKPFCGDCNRLRLSADGQAFTCLFGAHGQDLRPMLRGGVDDAWLKGALGGMWESRDDRYSELRGKTHVRKAEMSYLGG